MEKNTNELANVAPEIKALYDKGMSAFERRNYDYAVELFNQALALQQDFSAARQALHRTVRKRLEEESPSALAAVFNRLKGYLVTVKPVLLDLKGRSREAISGWEDALRCDPNNISLLNHLGSSLAKEEMTDSAINAFTETLSLAEKNTDALRQLGRLYAKIEDYDRSREYFRRLLEVIPHDTEAENTIKNLDAKQTIEKARWEDTETYRTKIRDTEKAKELEIKSRRVHTEDEIDYLIQRNEENLKKIPGNLEILRTLADLYSRKQDYARSIEYYEKALAVDKDNFMLLRKLGETKLKKIERQISEREKALAAGGPEAKKLEAELKELKGEIAVQRLDMVGKEVKQYPTNLPLRYQYGVLLRENGRLDEAVAQFQLSVKDSTKKIQSLNMLGVCFKEKSMFDLAIAQFQKALEQTSGLDEQTKEIIYNLGSAYEEMGNLQQAIDEYKKIFEVDISYRDIAQKINQAYQKKKKEESK